MNGWAEHMASWIFILFSHLVILVVLMKYLQCICKAENPACTFSSSVRYGNSEWDAMFGSVDKISGGEFNPGT